MLRSFRLYRLSLPYVYILTPTIYPPHLSTTCLSIGVSICLSVYSSAFCLPFCMPAADARHAYRSHTYIHTHTYIRTYVRTYIHTYMCRRHAAMLAKSCGAGMDAGGGALDEPSGTPQKCRAAPFDGGFGGQSAADGGPKQCVHASV